MTFFFNFDKLTLVKRKYSFSKSWHVPVTQLSSSDPMFDFISLSKLKMDLMTRFFAGCSFSNRWALFANFLLSTLQQTKNKIKLNFMKKIHLIIIIIIIIFIIKLREPIDFSRHLEDLQKSEIYLFKMWSIRNSSEIKNSEKPQALNFIKKNWKTYGCIQKWNPKLLFI